MKSVGTSVFIHYCLSKWSGTQRELARACKIEEAAISNRKHMRLLTPLRATPFLRLCEQCQVDPIYGLAITELIPDPTELFGSRFNVPIKLLNAWDREMSRRKQKEKRDGVNKTASSGQA